MEMGGGGKAGELGRQRRRWLPPFILGEGGVEVKAATLALPGWHWLNYLCGTSGYLELV